VHRSISIYFRFGRTKLEPYRAFLYDQRSKTVQEIGVKKALRLLRWSDSGFEPEREPPGVDLNPKWITKGLLNCSNPAWSPDGKSVAFVVGLGEHDERNRLQPTEIGVADSAGRSRRLVTNFGDSLTDCPQWSPDGRFLAFRRMPEKDDDPAGGYWLCELETGKLRQVDDDIAVASWSADSRSLVRDDSVTPIDGGDKRSLAKGEHIPTVDWDQLKRRNVEVWRYHRSIYLKSGLTVRQLVFKPGSNVEPALSPDGSKLAFSSFKFGTWGIWVADVSGER
jgi:Tol biopolymer transport system component